MLDCFLLSTFDRGLSTVDAEDPDTSEGVRVFPGTSSLGRRDDDVCEAGLDAARDRFGWAVGTVGVVLPWRDRSVTEDFDKGAR